MNILFITPYPPNPMRTRLRNFVIGLSARGHTIDVVAPYFSVDELKGVKNLQNYDINQYFIKLSKTASQLRALLALFDRVPLQQHYFISRKLKQQISRLVWLRQYDCIHIETFKVACSLPENLGLNDTTPIVIDAVDCFSSLYRQFAMAIRNPLWKRLYAIETNRVLEFEKQAMKNFHYVITSTKHEKLLLKKVNGMKKIISIDNGVDLNLFQPSSTSSIGKSENKNQVSVIAFSGKMNYIANSIAVLYFYNNIFPLIVKQLPDIKLKIIGAFPPKAIMNLAKDRRVEITGYVKNISDSINEAQVIVSPLILGAGIHNKILEAMALAKPVVTTPLACKSLNVKAGKELLVADNPNDFASSVIKLLHNPGLGRRMGLRARKYVEKHHQWEGKIDQLEKIYSSLIKI